MIHRNPEFIRNLWLEMTPQRLLAMPAILGLVFATGSLMEMGSGGSFAGLARAAQTLFILITIFWGAKLAADSLAQEFMQGTWDTQRLSSLGAWRMTLGKLLGGPVFAWYGGLICLGALLAARAGAGAWDLLRTALSLVLLALSFHALALLSTLRGWRKLPAALRQPQARNSGLVLLLILLGPYAFTASTLDPQDSGEVLWYGLSFLGADFVLLCAALAAFWSVFGLYRAMREELAFRDPPSAWLSFLLFLCAFTGGWFYPQAQPAQLFPQLALPPLAAHLAVCGLGSWLLSYVLLFQERKDWLRLRRLARAWQLGERQRVYELTPRWAVTLLVSAGLGLLFALAALLTTPLMTGLACTAVSLALLAFLLRDAALVLGLNFTRDQQRADSAAALYLGVLYLLLPLLIGALEWPLFLSAFIPFMVYEQPPWLIAGLLQAAAALDYARRRWNQLPQ